MARRRLTCRGLAGPLTVAMVLLVADADLSVRAAADAISDPVLLAWRRRLRGVRARDHALSIARPAWSCFCLLDHGQYIAMKLSGRRRTGSRTPRGAMRSLTWMNANLPPGGVARRPIPGLLYLRTGRKARRAGRAGRRTGRAGGTAGIRYAVALHVAEPRLPVCGYRLLYRDPAVDSSGSWKCKGRARLTETDRQSLTGIVRFCVCAARLGISGPVDPITTPVSNHLADRPPIASRWHGGCSRVARRRRPKAAASLKRKTHRQPIRDF